MALKVAVVVVDVAVLVLSRVNFGPEPFWLKKMGYLVNDILIQDFLHLLQYRAQ